MIQQAIAQELIPIYEEQFSDNSYGFRPGRSAHDALAKCREYVNEGYVYAISMDLQAYFDTVNHSKLIEVLSRTIKEEGNLSDTQISECRSNGRRRIPCNIGGRATGWPVKSIVWKCDAG